MINLCTFGIHKWPKWTKKSRSVSVNLIGGETPQTVPAPYQVRICKRCKKREEK